MNTFNLTTFQCVPGGVAGVLGEIERHTAASPSGSLRGCWVSEIGALNEVVVLRAFASTEALAQEPLGAAAIGSGDEGAVVLEVRDEVFEGFPGIAPLVRGRLGAFYEIRTYHLRPADEALDRTIEAWRAAVPHRISLSPLAVVMKSLAGPTRIVHIWPFESLDRRQAVRAEAFRQGWWPPRGTLQWMASAKTAVYIPASFSPLQ